MGSGRTIKRHSPVDERHLYENAFGDLQSVSLCSLGHVAQQERDTDQPSGHHHHQDHADHTPVLPTDPGAP